MSKPPKLSQKEHDAITARADKMFAGSREELANAGFGVTAKKANQQTATNLNTVRNNVIDSDVAFSLGYSDYSLSYDSNADLNTKAYYAAQSNELTSNLSSDLHYRENKFLSQMRQITASGDAAYQAGLNRGYVSAAMGRPGALNSLAIQKQSMIDFAVMNQQQYAYDQANPMGTWGDLALGMGKGFVDSVYQGVQFLGTSVAALTPLGQGISYATDNGALNPFDVEYHSIFDAPTNRMDAAGRFMGEVASAVVGGEGVLLAGANMSSKFGSRLNRVHEEFAGGTNSYIDDLSPYTGKRVRNGNRAINSIIAEDFSNLNLMYTPKFSPYASSGVTGYASHFKNPGVQIGSKSLESRATLRDTLVHEELHNRWRYKKGVVNNHHYPGKGAYPSDLKYRDMKFYTTVERYKRMRGWEYNKNWVNEWSNYVNSSAINRNLIINNHR